MTLQTRLFKRQSSYYFRARIPRDLRPYLGKTKEKFSLQTRDPAEARRLAWQGSVDFDARCHRLRKEIERRQGGKEPLVIDDALIVEIRALWRHQVLAADEHQRREGTFRDELREHRAERQQTAEALKATLAESYLARTPLGQVTFDELFDDWQRLDPNRPQWIVDDVRRASDDSLSHCGSEGGVAGEAWRTS